MRSDYDTYEALRLLLTAGSMERSQFEAAGLDPGIFQCRYAAEPRMPSARTERIRCRPGARSGRRLLGRLVSRFQALLDYRRRDFEYTSRAGIV